MAVSAAQLNNAKSAKKDEFYTLLETIEKELRNYSPELFFGKTVLCPCDDYEKSNFCKFFLERFSDFKLKSLVCTCYSGQRITDLTPDVPRGKYLVRDSEGTRTGFLKGNGDFRSPEILGLISKADYVITNPPFSLFRDFIEVCKDKKYLVLGNVTAVSYVKIFELLKTGKMFLGQSIKSGDIRFKVPDDYVSENVQDGVKYVNVPGIRWFTNIQEPKNDLLELSKTYNPEEYPRYDNYDAIDVSKTKNIPKDYPGLMGVPITFLDKFNPKQFRILDSIRPVLSGNHKFQRIIIENLIVNRSKEDSKQ